MQTDYWGEGTAFKTKAALMAWIRGGIRRSLWNRAPVKINFIKKYRKRIKNPNPKGKVATVWGGICALCNKEHISSNLDVDHIKGGHSLVDICDIQKFVEGIVLVSESDLQFVCKGCHKAKSLSERSGISFEDAGREKIAIALIKSKKDKEWLTERGVKPASNQALRRVQITEYLKEVPDDKEV